MGYVPGYETNVDIVREGLTRYSTFCSNLIGRMTGTTEYVIFKQTHDLTDVDYLYVGCLLAEEAGSNASLKIYFDTTLKDTLTTTQNALFGAGAIDTAKIDCTGITGEQIIKVTLVNDTVGDWSAVANLTIVGIDS